MIVCSIAKLHTQPSGLSKTRQSYGMADGTAIANSVGRDSQQNGKNWTGWFHRQGLGPGLEKRNHQLNSTQLATL